MRPIAPAHVLVIALAATGASAAPGPGLGNVAWSSGQVFSPVGYIDAPQTQRAEGHGNVTMVQGYLMVITSSDGGGNADDGAIEFWDVSDPTSPARVVRHDDTRTHGLREAHGFSLAHVDGRLVLAAQGIEGVMLWDVTEPLAIELLSYTDLPGVVRGDYTGDWWVFWQAPWLFVAGVDDGLSVLDTTSLTAPTVAAHLPTGELAGVSPSQAFALGNLLVLMESQERAFLTLDISSPAAPRVLRRLDGKPGYSHIFAADGKIFTSGNIPPRVHVHQVAPDGGIGFVSTFELYFNSGGYGSYQDGFFHSGFSDQYVKFDVAAQSEVGRGSSGRTDRDEDFAVVLGNLVFAGDDHGHGTALIPHQGAPDTTPPSVMWMHPPADSTDLAPSTRVGLSFSDLIDVASLTTSTSAPAPGTADAGATVWLQDELGQRVPALVSAQMGLVNIAPQAPLERQRSYRVVVDGARDLAGNAAPHFEATITIGDGGAAQDPVSLVANLDTNSPFGAYAVLPFGTGAVTYADRTFAFVAGYPERFADAAYVQTRNNDKLSISADFVSLELLAPAEVAVLYDSRASSTPDWLDSYAATGETVTNDDTTYDVFSRAFPAGAVGFGGNNATGAAGADSMYSIVIVPERLDCSLALAPAVAGTVTLRGAGAAAQDPSTTWDWQVGDAQLADAGSTVAVSLAPGRHAVVATVQKGPQVAVCSGVQIVHRPAAAQPAVTSASLLWRGGRAVAVNPDAGTVTAVDAASGAVAWETAAGTRPVALALDADGGALFVVDRDGAQVIVLDAETGAPVRTSALPYGSRPEAIVVDDTGAYVTLGALGEVARLDDNGAIAQRAFVVPTARGLTLFEGRLYVSRWLSAPVADTSDPDGDDPDGGDGVGEIVVVDASTLATLGAIALATDTGPDTEASGRGVLSQLSPLRIAADGTRAIVAGTKANTQRGVFRDGLPLSFESRTRAFVATIDLAVGAVGEEVRDERRDVNDRDMVQGAAHSPLADLVFVAAQGGNVVDVLDASTGRRVSQITTEKAPQALAFSSTGTLAVQNTLSRTLSLYDARGLLDGTSNHVTPLAVVRTVAVEPLAPEVLRGKQLFYDAADRRMSKDGFISCASCHLDGGHDGRTWDFTQAGEGLRNTIALQGRAGTGHGRVHWTANFDEIQDFENDIRNGFGGTGLLTDADFAATSNPLGAAKAGRSADLDALAAFVASLTTVPASPHREVDGALTDAARRGRLVYVAAGCAECHAGATFTDAVRHDVGTARAGSGLGIGEALAGIGFDTPTLLGVWDTAPYLHDGSAPTLADALLRHGEVPLLEGAAPAGSAARDDLVAYLRELDSTSGAPEADCAVTDECVRPDVPPPDDVVEPGADDVAGAGGCGCAGSSPTQAWFAVAWLALFGATRRRPTLRSRPHGDARA